MTRKQMWLRGVLSGAFLAFLVISLGIQVHTARQVAQQTALLERIGAMVERWEAAGQAGKTAGAARHTDAMQGWGVWTKSGGLKELPTQLK